MGIFFSRKGIAEAKWQEGVVNSWAKRNGKKGYVSLTECGCGPDHIITHFKEYTEAPKVNKTEVKKIRGVSGFGTIILDG